MDWIVLICAGAFEVLGVVGMNKVAKKKSIAGFILLGLGFLCSFFLLSVAMRTLPLGVSYAIWTGIGTVGGALIGMLFYDEPKDVMRIFCIAIIVVAVVGLKIFA